ncbi:unnamed protein product [Penicillium salamii]|uniref:F-box domain-containing protein n=1 Tax=Penicillium salamii TaxID=1612424 RepID=A0A9W4JIS2_9EURO|nr:unnamed protein product [Penicillium salamii]CAG8051778.1 unnamed protein product [Penicillium salamii]CAG8106603.1 unnamed protein product [Penicillium salamii]CAG8275670.1 unnamed protein product [Penicillium salamii]CAG8283598.1 unnamed protein product [Penicillium salamii]
MGNMEKDSRLFQSFFHRNQCHHHKGEQYYLLAGDEKEAHHSCGTTQSAAARRIKFKQCCLKGKLYVARSWTKVPLLSSLVFWIRRKNLILSLPDTVLVKIHEELPIIDAVCLALTCKRLSKLFTATLKEKDFEFPRLLELRNPLLCLNYSRITRNQLLLRLENRRWLYCGQCLRLHPRKVFDRENKYWAPSLIRSCSRYAGIVDICPCAAWTIRDRDRAVKLLKSTSPSGTQFGPFLFQSGSRPSLEHTCHLSSNEEYDADVAISIYIDPSNHLLVHAKYVLRLTPAYISIEPLLFCPHFSLSGSSIICPVSYCPSCFAAISNTENNKTNVLFEVTRDFGSCESTDDSCWLRNCRPTGHKLRESTVQCTNNITKGPSYHRNSVRKITVGIGHVTMNMNNWICKDSCRQHMKEL